MMLPFDSLFDAPATQGLEISISDVRYVLHTSLLSITHPFRNGSVSLLLRLGFEFVRDFIISGDLAWSNAMEASCS